MATHKTGPAGKLNGHDMVIVKFVRKPGQYFSDALRPLISKKYSIVSDTTYGVIDVEDRETDELVASTSFEGGVDGGYRGEEAFYTEEVVTLKLPAFVLKPGHAALRD